MSIRRRLITLGAAAAATALLTLLTATPADAAPSGAELAQRWAPIHFQDTDSSDYDADYLTSVNFDGDWNTANNWESQDDQVRRLRGTVYYSVVATATHWFVLYGFYHPRDWSDTADPANIAEHENDMEGVLLTVKKDSSRYGTLQAMVTVAHRDFYSYLPARSRFTAGRETIDGTVVMRNYQGLAHPTTMQEAKGHGAYAWNGHSFPGGDGVVYYPSGHPEVPTGGNDRSVGYRLVDILEPGGLWTRLKQVTAFRGDNGKDDAANPPWGWRDHDDSLRVGAMAKDPATLVSTYFADKGKFALNYIDNEYR